MREFEKFLEALNNKGEAEKVIMNDKELIDLLAEMLNFSGQKIESPKTVRSNPDVVYLYVLERTLENGTKHYHPVVANQVLTFNAKDYRLMAGSNLLGLQEEYGYMSAYPNVKIMAISHEQFGNILNALHKFVQALINKVELAVQPLASLNIKGYNVEDVKRDMLAKIFAASESVGHALLENGTIVNVTSETEYVEDYENDYDEDYEDDYDDDYDDDEWLK